MNDWKHTKLIDLADFINGHAFKPSDWGKEGLPIIRIEQLKNPDSIQDYFEGKLPEEQIINDGDLIFSWSASLFLRIWQHGKAALNQHLFKVINREDVDRHFLKFLIEYYLPTFTKSAHGSTMQHITRRELEKFEVLVPSGKNEQTKIAEILSKIEKAIEQTEAIIAKKHRIKAGLMQDLLTCGLDENGEPRDPVANPEQFKASPFGRIPIDWEVVDIESIVDSAILGVGLRGERPAGENIPLIKMGNIIWGGIVFNQLEFISQSVIKNLELFFLQPGDFLFNTRNTPDLVGKSGVWEGQFKKAVFDNNLLRIRFKKGINSKIICAYMNQGIGKNCVRRMVTGTTSVAAIYWKALKNFLIPIPRVSDEQQLIVEILDASESCLRSDEGFLCKLIAIKKGLMQDLFTGKISATILV